MEQLQFKISSALKDLVGKDLITNDYIAIFELVKNSYDAYASKVEITFAEDKIKDKGPMPGIMTGLSYITSNYALVLPCDSPYVSQKYVKTIFKEIDVNYQAIVPFHDSDMKLKTSEPLHSIYSKNIIPIIEELINTDVLHIKGLIEKIDTKFVLIDNKKIEKKEFRNLNRPSDI